MKLPKTIVFRVEDNYYGEFDYEKNVPYGRGRKIKDFAIREGFWTGNTAFPTGQLRIIRENTVVTANYDK